MRGWYAILRDMWGSDAVPWDLVEFCERLIRNIKVTNANDDSEATLRSKQIIALIVELYRTGMSVDINEGRYTMSKTIEPITSYECPCCGETTYFYKVGPVTCDCGMVLNLKSDIPQYDIEVTMENTQ